MLGPRFVLNCHLSELAINSTLSVATKTKLFGPVNGWDGLFSRDLFGL